MTTIIDFDVTRTYNNTWWGLVIRSRFLSSWCGSDVNHCRLWWWRRWCDDSLSIIHNISYHLTQCCLIRIWSSFRTSADTVEVDMGETIARQTDMTVRWIRWTYLWPVRMQNATSMPPRTLIRQRCLMNSDPQMWMRSVTKTWRWNCQQWLPLVG